VAVFERVKKEKGEVFFFFFLKSRLERRARVVEAVELEVMIMMAGA
jgi:hypothetical protein